MNRDVMILNAMARRHGQREIDRHSRIMRNTLCIYKTLELIPYVAAENTGDTHTPDVDTIHWVYERLRYRWTERVQMQGMETAPIAVRRFLLCLKWVVDRSHYAAIDRLADSVVGRMPVSEVLEQALPMIPVGKTRLRRFVRGIIQLNVTNAHNATASNLACSVFNMERDDWVEWVAECMEYNHLN